MEQIENYITLLAIIAIIGLVFNRSKIPISLILVLVGMLLSPFLHLNYIDLNPSLVLDVFLPLLLYQISTSASWKDVKKNVRPISLLSVGHVIFITFLVAFVFHLLLPELGWPLAFILGAVISPPDDVAIVSIADKVRMPQRLLTILEGEGMLNDATALIIFRFALAAMITHQFAFLDAIEAFVAVVVAEIAYGLTLGHALGKLRLKIDDPILHMMVSILTPFLAYLPAERLGGSGVLATVTTGFVIGHYYSVKFSAEFRIISRAVWPTISYALQNWLFLLVGFNIIFIWQGIAAIPPEFLALYGLTIVAAIIIGRFVWIYPASYLPRLFFKKIRSKEPHLPWQYPILVSWAGMRGGISLAAALAIPALPATAQGYDARDLIIFLVFCAILATLVMQGLTLPWLLKILGAKHYSQQEQYHEHLAELKARIKMIKAVLQWLKEYKELAINNPKLLSEIRLQLKNYQALKKSLLERIKKFDSRDNYQAENDVMDSIYLKKQIIAIEKQELLRLWQEEHISHSVRNKLLDQLDHRAKHVQT